MQIKIINNRLKLYTRSVGRIDNLSDLFNAYYWKSRINRHKRWKFISKFIIKTLAMMLLKRSNMYRRHIKRYKSEPKIVTLDKAYKSECYKQVKGQYNTDINYYSMRMSVAEYGFHGNSEYEIYLRLIDRIIFQELNYPYCIKGGIVGVINRKIEDKRKVDEDE